MLHQSSYFNLPNQFYTEDKPDEFPNSQVLLFNENLASDLGISDIDQNILQGKSLTSPAISLAYAGHQFGHFVPQLGDGRAHLLGEIRSEKKSYDLQLKGSGATFYSRGGDGLSPLGPALREFLISEAINYLGIPTTRSLSVVSTGEAVYRQDIHPGGIVARVASAHIRVGTFEFFAAREQKENLLTLIEYTKKRLYPSVSDGLMLFDTIVQNQARLIAKWMSVGFIHGVMNTDNMSLAGETIDYGPCAFMNQFRKNQVYSSIDRRGRYAFSNQPAIAAWNLSILAGCFLYALGEENRDPLERSLANFESFYQSNLQDEFSKKFGLSNARLESKTVDAWLDYLDQYSLDFTLAHRNLAELLLKEPSPFYPDNDKLNSIIEDWKNCMQREGLSEQNIAANINKSNPLYIPRNHQVDKALTNAENRDMQLYLQILAAIREPYTPNQEFTFLEKPPEQGEDIPATFCGT